MSSSVGSRAFSVAGPQAWNRLPAALRHTDCVDSFKRQLKFQNCTFHGGVLRLSISNFNSVFNSYPSATITAYCILLYCILTSYFIVTYFCPAPLSNFVRGALQIPLIDWLLLEIQPQCHFKSLHRTDHPYEADMPEIHCLSARSCARQTKLTNREFIWGLNNFNLYLHIRKINEHKLYLWYYCVLWTCSEKSDSVLSLSAARCYACKRGLYAAMRCACSWIVSKLINISWTVFHRRVDPSFSFFRAKRHSNIPTGTPLTGASNAGVVGRNRDSEPGFSACC